MLSINSFSYKSNLLFYLANQPPSTARVKPLT
nr:MAG TPA: hypothetical protein [Caudoviricetes sp.]